MSEVAPSMSSNATGVWDGIRVMESMETQLQIPDFEENEMKQE